MEAVSHYEFDRKNDVIGVGGMSVTYKARDTKLDRYVALKQIIGDGTPDGDKRAQNVWERESKEMARLSHPGLPAIYEIINQTGFYIAQEYIEGKTLEEILDSGRMPEKQALELMLAVARVVSYLHSNSVYHNDINTKNIMVDKNGLVKIIDFGIARGNSRTSSTRILTSSGVGTPPYCSPEQYSSAFEANAQSEVYSLGVTLHQLLSDQPFPEAMDRAIKNAKIPELKKQSSWAPELIRIIKKATQLIPEQRYESVDKMIKDLNSVQQIEYKEGKPSPIQTGFTRIVRSLTRMLSPEPESTKPMVQVNEPHIHAQAQPSSELTLDMRIDFPKAMSNAYTTCEAGNEVVYTAELTGLIVKGPNIKGQASISKSLGGRQEWTISTNLETYIVENGEVKKDGGCNIDYRTNLVSNGINQGIVLTYELFELLLGPMEEALIKKREELLEKHIITKQ